MGVGGVHKANVAVTPSGCAFSALDDQSPCLADACADPESEGCLVVIQGYCLEHPEDEGCALVLPYFQRVRGEEVERTGD